MKPGLALLLCMTIGCTDWQAFVAAGDAEPSFVEEDGGAADSAPSRCSAKINEVQAAGLDSPSDEFIELYNPCAAPFDLTGYKLFYRSAAGEYDVLLVSFLTASAIGPGGYVVCASYAYLGPSDYVYGSSIALQGGGLALRRSEDKPVDAVGYGAVQNAYVETAPAPLMDKGQSIVRRPDGHDSGDNATDFVLTTRPTPGMPNE